jgi:hypothetical protein
MQKVESKLTGGGGAIGLQSPAFVEKDYYAIQLLKISRRNLLYVTVLLNF